MLCTCNPFDQYTFSNKGCLKCNFDEYWPLIQHQIDALLEWGVQFLFISSQVYPFLFYVVTSLCVIPDIRKERKKIIKPCKRYYEQSKGVTHMLLKSGVT